MRNIYILGFIALSFTCFGQRKIIGRIIDGEDSKPIKNVKITIPQSTNESFTNHLGFFELEIDQSTRQLNVIHVAYGVSEISIPEQGKFLIKLTKLRSEIPDIDLRSFSKNSKYQFNSDSTKQNNRNSLAEMAKFEGGTDSLFRYLGTKLTIDETIEDNFVCGANHSFSVNTFFTVQRTGQ